MEKAEGPGPGGEGPGGEAVRERRERCCCVYDARCLEREIEVGGGNLEYPTVLFSTPFFN